MKAVMYHYVRDYDASLPNFRFLNIDSFRKQLDYFEHNFGFVDFDEWDAFTTSGTIPHKKGKVLLTFDDAMRCHFDYVYPELLRRGLWGIFYIPVKPYTMNQLLDVHKIHLLCGAFDGQILLDELVSMISEGMVPDKIQKTFKATYLRQENQAGVSEFKRVLNYYIDYRYREPIIDSLANKLQFNFSPSDFYISEENIQTMDEGGMVIGSHTLSHPVMSKLGRSEQLDEIKASFQFLENLGVIQSRTYCHPYGGFHTFNHDTISLLQTENVHYSFNVEAREIESNDFFKSMHYLPRFDCNLFKHGKAS